MFRFVLMTGKWYALEIDEELYSDVDSILHFANEGTVVAICDDVETFADQLGINVADIIMASDDDDGQ